MQHGNADIYKEDDKKKSKQKGIEGKKQKSE